MFQRLVFVISSVFQVHFQRTLGLYVSIFYAVFELVIFVCYFLMYVSLFN